MSTASAPDDGEPPFPTVTHRYVSRPDGEMSLVGWGMFALLLVLLVPLLPFLVVAWVVSKLFGPGRQ